MLKNDCAIVKALDQGDDHEGGNDEPPLIPVVQREWKSIQIAECIELEHGANVGAGIVVVLVEVRFIAKYSILLSSISEPRGQKIAPFVSFHVKISD